MELPISNKLQISPGVYHATLVSIDDVGPGRHGEHAFQFQYRIELPGGRYRTLGRTYYGPFTKDSGLAEDCQKIFACAGHSRKVSGAVESELLLNTRVRLRVEPSNKTRHYKLHLIGPEPVRGSKTAARRAGAIPLEDIER
jgi:hypothetical protein